MENATVEDCPDQDFAMTISLVTVDSLIAVVAIIGNSLVILSVIRFHNLRTNTNMFVVSLAVADFFVGISIPYYVSFYFKSFRLRCDRYPCLVRYVIILFPTITSMLSNIAVAVERYVAVIRPLSYHDIMNRKWVVRSIVIGWMYIAIVTSLPLIPGMNEWSEEKVKQCENASANCFMECDLYYIVSEEYAISVVGLHVSLTLIVTLGLYYRIFREAWKLLRSVASLELNPTIKREAKTSRMMVLVLGVCLLGLMPYLVAVMYPYSVADKSKIDEKTWGLCKKWVVCLYLGKSSLNPFIYGWKNRDFREAFLKLLKVRRRHSQRDMYERRDTNPNNTGLRSLFTLTK